MVCMKAIKWTLTERNISISTLTLIIIFDVIKMSVNRCFAVQLGSIGAKARNVWLIIFGCWCKSLGKMNSKYFLICKDLFCHSPQTWNCASVTISCLTSPCFYSKQLAFNEQFSHLMRRNNIEVPIGMHFGI